MAFVRNQNLSDHTKSRQATVEMRPAPAPSLIAKQGLPSAYSRRLSRQLPTARGSLPLS